MASKIWSISSEPKRSLPRKSMCSSRCEMPAWLSSSTTDPAAIQKPSATERTPGTRSVTTRTPLSSVAIRCSSLNRRSTLVAAVARAARAALAVAARSPLRALAPVAAAATVTGASAAPAGADADELLDGLAGDVRVVGQPQADAAALAVDLDHADVDLVALVQHVLDALDALAG